MTDQLREVIEPDIFMTGDANLLMEAKDKQDPKSDLLTRVLSVLVHVGLIIFLIFTPKIFPPHVPTQQEIDLAQANSCRWIYTPPELPKTAPPPSPKLHITAKTLNKISPKIEQPVIPAPPGKSGKAAHGPARSAEAAGRGSATGTAGSANSCSFSA